LGEGRGKKIASWLGPRASFYQREERHPEIQSVKNWQATGGLRVGIRRKGVNGRGTRRERKQVCKDM